MNTVDVTLRTAAAVERKKMRAERFALLRRNPAFIAGVVIAMFWLVSAIIGNKVVPIDPDALDLMATDVGPSSTHWFGTDSLGRDV